MQCGYIVRIIIILEISLDFIIKKFLMTRKYFGSRSIATDFVISANFRSLYIDNVGALSETFPYDYKTATCVALSPLFKFF